MPLNLEITVCDVKPVAAWKPLLQVFLNAPVLIFSCWFYGCLPALDRRHRVVFRYALGLCLGDRLIDEDRRIWRGCRQHRYGSDQRCKYEFHGFVLGARLTPPDKTIGLRRRGL